MKLILFVCLLRATLPFVLQMHSGFWIVFVFLFLGSEHIKVCVCDAGGAHCKKTVEEEMLDAKINKMH